VAGAHSARTVAAVVLACWAIGAVVVAWSQPMPDLTAEDAVTATEGALAGAGVDGVVDNDPRREVYASRSRAPVDVWTVRALVREAPIEVRLARAGAQPVEIDDRTLDGTTYVLSQAEYEAVARHVDDPSRARAVWRNVVLTFAAVLIVALSLAHLATDRPKEPR
jgi:hypothetical protein